MPALRCLLRLFSCLVLLGRGRRRHAGRRAGGVDRQADPAPTGHARYRSAVAALRGVAWRRRPCGSLRDTSATRQRVPRVCSVVGERRNQPALRRRASCARAAAADAQGLARPAASAVAVRSRDAASRVNDRVTPSPRAGNVRRHRVGRFHTTSASPTKPPCRSPPSAIRERLVDQLGVGGRGSSAGAAAGSPVAHRLAAATPRDAAPTTGPMLRYRADRSRRRRPGGYRRRQRRRPAVPDAAPAAPVGTVRVTRRAQRPSRYGRGTAG